MNLIGSYVNGNYKCSIYKDGTKLRENRLDSLIPDTVESIDLKITNRCDINCPFCHEGSTVDGVHGDILSASFIDKLHPYTELAIGGGNPLCHPDLVDFLQKCKRMRLIPSITVNQKHFINNYYYIKSLVDRELIYGIGVSMYDFKDTTTLIKLEEFKNVVVHVIHGIVNVDDLKTISHKNLKLLILGYKEFGRGEDNYQFHSDSIEVLKNSLKKKLPTIIAENWFDVVSFDNLAISQLELSSIMPAGMWDEFYMGDDGKFTMYVDMVEKKFAKTSCTLVEDRMDLLPTIEEMFNIVREDKN